MSTFLAGAQFGCHLCAHMSDAGSELLPRCEPFVGANPKVPSSHNTKSRISHTNHVSSKLLKSVRALNTLAGYSGVSGVATPLRSRAVRRLRERIQKSFSASSTEPDAALRALLGTKANSYSSESPELAGVVQGETAPLQRDLPLFLAMLVDVI